MTKNFYSRTLLAAMLAFALLAGRAVGEDRLADAVPAYNQLEGIYYIAQVLPQANGIYIVDPKVVRIGNRLFLTGREAGGNDGVRKTEFSDGTAYIALSRIAIIQQVPQSR